jgi:predicted patatin/cPLA2 family phospholipase
VQQIIESEIAKNILVRAGMALGDKHNLRTGIFCAGGAQTGAFSAGILHWMHDIGLHDKFDFVVASSASAPNCGWFLSGNGPAGISYYWEENCRNFINPFRFWKIVDLGKLEHALRYTKPLDIKSVRSNPTNFFVTLTDLEGKGRLFDVKSWPDMIAPIVASCGLPIFWNRPRMIGSQGYLDGSMALPLPVSRIVQEFQLTDLLVVVNQLNMPQVEECSMFEKVAARCLLRHYSGSLERVYLDRKRRYNEGLAEANSVLVENGTSDPCRVTVLAPSYNIPKHCTDIDILKSFHGEGRNVASNFFLEEMMKQM